MTQEPWFAILWTWAGGIWFGADTRERGSEPVHAAGSAPLLPKEPPGKFTLTQAPTEQSHLHSRTHNVAEVFRTHGAPWWRKASPRVKNTQNGHVGTQLLNKGQHLPRGLSCWPASSKPYPSTCIFCLGEGTTFPVTWTENYGTLPEPQLPYWSGWEDSWGWKTVFQSNYQWLSRGYQGRPWTRGLTWCPVILTAPYEVSSYNSHVADNENRAFVYVKEFWGYWGAQNITCLRIHS